MSDFKQFNLPDQQPPLSPFEYQNGQWILKSPIATSDFVNGQSGFQLDPTSGFSKINAFGGNVVLYDAVVDASGKGQFRTIQDAINAGKKRIFVRSGEYKLTKRIEIREGDFMIVGESAETTILKTPANTSQIIYIAGTSTVDIENIAVSNLTFDTNDVTSTAVTLSYVNNLKLFNCIFKNYASAAGAIYASLTCSNISVHHNYFFNVKTAYFGVANKLSFMNNYAEGRSDEEAIRAYSCVDAAFRDNVFYGFAQGLICVDAIGLDITNNIIENIELQAIYLSACQYGLISGNKIKSACLDADDTYSAVYLKTNNPGEYCLKNIITNNIITSGEANEPKYGIHENDAFQDYNLVSNNIIENVATSGILLQGANSVSGDNIII